MTNLLPCPFCGSSVNKLYEREALAWVACLDCGLEAPTETGVTKDQAIAYWNTRSMPLQDHAKPQLMEIAVTEDQIKHMVNRFLSWKLPDSFNPDGGISFQAIGNAGTEHQYKRQPSGTNLLDATQADAMVRHMIEGMT